MATALKFRLKRRWRLLRLLTGKSVLRLALRVSRFATCTLLVGPLLLLVGSHRAPHSRARLLPDFPDFALLGFITQRGILLDVQHFLLGIFPDGLDLVILLIGQVQRVVVFGGFSVEFRGRSAGLLGLGGGRGCACDPDSPEPLCWANAVVAKPRARHKLAAKMIALSDFMELFLRGSSP